MTTSERQTFTAPTSPGSRGRVRTLAVALSAAVAAAYLVLFVLVRDAERGESENTFGAYLFLFLAYAAGAVVLGAWDLRAVQLAGAVVQVAVLVLFVVFAVGLLGPGVFAYDAVSKLHMPLWALGITAAQVALLVVLVRLAVTAPPRGTLTLRRP